VEMDEMEVMYLEIVIDVLDDRVELMGTKPDEKTKKILFDVEAWLVFEHTLFDRVYTNFFHLLNCLEYAGWKLKLNKTLFFCLIDEFSYQLFQNLEYISHAKEDCHLMYYGYRDMWLVEQVMI